MRKVFILIGILLALVGLSSCGTLPYQQSEADVYAVIDAISAGDTDFLVENSQVPFLLNAEIIMMEDHVRTIWSVFSDNKFSLSNIEIINIRLLEEDDVLLFSSRNEVRIFFNKYCDLHTSFIEFQSDKGRFYMLLGNQKNGFSQIIGIKGPVE